MRAGIFTHQEIGGAHIQLYGLLNYIMKFFDTLLVKFKDKGIRVCMRDLLEAGARRLKDIQEAGTSRQRIKNEKELDVHLNLL